MNGQSKQRQPQSSRLQGRLSRIKTRTVLCKQSQEVRFTVSDSDITSKQHSKCDSLRTAGCDDAPLEALPCNLLEVQSPALPRAPAWSAPLPPREATRGCRKWPPSDTQTAPCPARKLLGTAAHRQQLQREIRRSSISLKEVITMKGTTNEGGFTH